MNKILNNTYLNLNLKPMKNIPNNNPPYKLLLLLLCLTCISQIQAEHSEDYILFSTEDICSIEKPDNF